MLVADGPVPVFPTPFAHRGHCTGKTVLGRDLPDHVLAVARPSPDMGQAEEVEVGPIRLRMACALRHLWAEIDEACLVGMEPEPSPPRRPRCNLPARCNALRVRTTIRRASAGASGSRPAGYNDGHGAAESRRVAGAPAATRAPPPVARAPDRRSPHGLGLEPTPATVHPLGAIWPG